MGPAFVRRRMMAELGPDWAARFKSFEPQPAASASLGQVHRAVAHDGAALAAKLQYPDMQSAVEADLNQLKVVFALHARMNPAIETGEILKEISARLREELDYELEARHTALYAPIFKDEPRIRVPEVLPELSTKRLLTMTWLEGRRAARLQGGAAGGSQRHRARHVQGLVVSLLALRRDPRRPASRQLHDLRSGPRRRARATALGEPAGINLLDYGCIRTFPTPFVQGVIDLYTGLLTGKRDLVVHAYETWGFAGLSTELIDALNIWARFIYGPLLDDREREIAEGTTPGQYGRKEAFTVHKALKEKGPVRVPREFVFMDRAAIGLGGVFLHLGAKLNWHNMFNDTIRGLHAGRGGRAAEGGVRGGGRAAADSRVTGWPSKARSGSGSAAGRSSRGAGCSIPRGCRIPRSWSMRAAPHHHRDQRHLLSHADAGHLRQVGEPRCPRASCSRSRARAMR